MQKRVPNLHFFLPGRPGAPGRVIRSDREISNHEWVKVFT